MVVLDANKYNFIVHLFCNTWKVGSVLIINNQKRSILFFSYIRYRKLEENGILCKSQYMRFSKGEVHMEREKLLKKSTKVVVDIATKYLKADANAASCIVFHQPKAPKELSRFKKKK